MPSWTVRDTPICAAIAAAMQNSTHCTRRVRQSGSRTWNPIAGGGYDFDPIVVAGSLELSDEDVDEIEGSA